MLIQRPFSRLDYRFEHRHSLQILQLLVIEVILIQFLFSDIDFLLHFPIGIRHLKWEKFDRTNSALPQGLFVPTGQYDGRSPDILQTTEQQVILAANKNHTGHKHNGHVAKTERQSILYPDLQDEGKLEPAVSLEKINRTPQTNLVTIQPFVTQN